MQGIPQRFVDVVVKVLIQYIQDIHTCLYWYKMLISSSQQGPNFESDTYILLNQLSCPHSDPHEASKLIRPLCLSFLPQKQLLRLYQLQELIEYWRHTSLLYARTHQQDDTQIA
ncbi:MAG: hypothetical protein IPH93_13195 [Saprospiraceae bacterium]|nr:hypothetical protein [Saprospiraceae bacterium]